MRFDENSINIAEIAKSFREINLLSLHLVVLHGDALLRSVEQGGFSAIEMGT